MSKKGTTWSKHKYIRIENGRYIYKENSAKESKQIDTALKGYDGTIKSLNPNLIKGMSRSAISGLAASLIARNKERLKNFKLGKGKSGSSSSKSSGGKGSAEKKTSEKKGSSKEKTEKESTKAVKETTAKTTTTVQNEQPKVDEGPKYTVDTEYTKRLEEFVNKDRSKLPIIYKWAENELRKQKQKIKHYDAESPYMVNGKIFTSTDEKPDFNSLEHHGIKGQKWGVKNGPPYPLGSDKSTGKRLKSTKGSIVKKKTRKTKQDIQKRRQALDEWEKFAKELDKSEELVSLNNKRYDLQTQLEALDVGSKSIFGRTKRGQKKIEELTKELKEVNAEHDKLFNYIKDTYDDIQESKKKVPEDIQKYIDNNPGYDLGSKRDEYRRYLKDPDGWKLSPDRYSSKENQTPYLSDQEKKAITKQFSSEMVGDLKRWNKADVSPEIKKSLEKDIAYNLEVTNHDGIIRVTTGSKHYHNGEQPLTAIYDPKKKKIRNVDYL